MRRCGCGSVRMGPTAMRRRGSRLRELRRTGAGREVSDGGTARRRNEERVEWRPNVNAKRRVATGRLVPDAGNPGNGKSGLAHGGVREHGGGWKSDRSINWVSLRKF